MTMSHFSLLPMTTKDSFKGRSPYIRQAFYFGFQIYCWAKCPETLFVMPNPRENEQFVKSGRAKTLF